MTKKQCRVYAAALALLVALLAAGCLEYFQPAPATPTPAPAVIARGAPIPITTPTQTPTPTTPTPTPTPALTPTAAAATPTPTPTPTTLGVLNVTLNEIVSTCAIPRDGVGALIQPLRDGVVIRATFFAPNPCHRVNAITRKSNARIFVDLTLLPPAQGIVCIQCIATKVVEVLFPLNPGNYTIEVALAGEARKTILAVQQVVVG